MNLLLLGISDQQFADKRQLLLFGGEQHPAMMQQQLHLLQKVSDGVKERDLTITVIKKESLLWKKYEVQAGTFTVILIGKDGTEKHRTNSLLTATDLFALIDAMPMRKAEIRKNN